MTDTTRSFDSWDSLNEGLFNNYLAKGKGKLKQPGRDAILAYKVKDQETFRYTLKNVAALPRYIKDHNLTSEGGSFILKDLNGKAEFIATIGKLDSSFFSNKMLIYTIKRESENVLSVQFKVVARNEEELTKLGLNPKLTMISSKAFDAAKVAASGITLDSNLEAAVDANKKEAEEKTDDKDLKSEEDAKGNPEAAKLAGTSFRATMRTNGVTYKFTFNEEGLLEAVPEDSSYSNAKVAAENGSVMWYVADVNKSKSKSKNDLNSDTEIVNKQDKNFLLKMLTDDNYRKEYLEKNIDKISGIYDNESIKAIIFDRNDKLVFGDYSKVGKDGDQTNKAEADSSDGYSETLAAGISAAKKKAEELA